MLMEVVKLLDGFFVCDCFFWYYFLCFSVFVVVVVEGFVFVGELF